MSDCCVVNLLHFSIWPPGGSRTSSISDADPDVGGGRGSSPGRWVGHQRIGPAASGAELTPPTLWMGLGS